MGEYGTAKAVLGLELDFTYGQTGSGNTNVANLGRTVTAPTGAVANWFGTSGSYSLNTDVRGPSRSSGSTRSSRCRTSRFLGVDYFDAMLEAALFPGVR